MLLASLASPAVAGWGLREFPTQSAGDRGTDVLAIQLLLRHHGQVAPVNATYDPATVAAVTAFETAIGQTPNGIVERMTWLRLVVPLGPGDSGPAVRALQFELNAKRGARLPLTQAYDAATQAAVRTFQRHAGLPVDGRASKALWLALTWHYELPVFAASSLCDYSVGNGPANWGTASTTRIIELAGAAMVRAGHGRVAVGDVSLEHGGPIPGHISHRTGLDVDLRPMRRANNQCTWGGSYRLTTYDRAATRALVRAIRDLAGGHVKLIYFNDPVLIAEGLTSRYPGHDDHLHVRFCQAGHPDPAYRC